MGKILIVSPSMKEQEDLQSISDLHGGFRFDFETTVSFGQPPHYWFQTPPEALILKLPESLELQKYYFEKMQSDLPKTTRVVFLCESVSSGLMEVSRRFERVRLVKTPATAYFLYRSLCDVTTDYPPSQAQAFPRFLTDQPMTVQLATDLTSQGTPALMKNLSQSGIYFEIEEVEPRFKVRDVVRVHIEITGIREYNFDAKVIWLKKETSAPIDPSNGMPMRGQFPPRVAYGCAFTVKEQIYDSLITQLNKNKSGVF